MVKGPPFPRRRGSAHTLLFTIITKCRECHDPSVFVAAGFVTVRPYLSIVPCSIQSSEEFVGRGLLVFIGLEFLQLVLVRSRPFAQV